MSEELLDLLDGIEFREGDGRLDRANCDATVVDEPVQSAAWNAVALKDLASVDILLVSHYSDLIEPRVAVGSAIEPSKGELAVTSVTPSERLAVNAEDLGDRVSVILVPV